MQKTIEELIKELPEGTILQLIENKEIEQCARLEAEMTFMKSKNSESTAAAIYMYPEIIRTKEDMFLFAMSFGRYLAELNHNLRKISPQVIQMFASRN